ncbi:hypothetical protein AABM38_13160 [Heyndrickxia sp. MSNUG]|uniref:hypothetical protein n=1 Tax=Heyndrickxia sp. MSNUG TaxID=3136677 RepID=UPI003C2B1347
MEGVFSYKSQMAAAALLGAFHGINPAMGWLFAVFLAIHRSQKRVLFYAIIPIATGQILGDGLVIAAQTFARFHLPAGTVHLSIAAFIVIYGIYRLFRYYRHFKWAGGLNVGYGQLILWSFLASSTHGSGLLFAPFILEASSIMDLVPLWIVHEMVMLTSMTVISLSVYHLGIAKFKKYLVNFELVWAILLIAVGVLLFVMGGGMGQEHIH